MFSNFIQMYIFLGTKHKTKIPVIKNKCTKRGKEYQGNVPKYWVSWILTTSRPKERRRKYYQVNTSLYGKLKIGQYKKI